MTVRASIFAEDDPPSKAAGLDAALALFVRDGVEATSVRDIATRSGFTNPAIFKHFDSKTALALCLFERCYAWMARAFVAAENACADPDPVAQILAVVGCALQLMDEDIEAILMVQDNLRRFWPMAASTTRAVSLLGRMRTLVAAAADARNVEGAERMYIAPNLLASAIIGLLGQIAREAYFHEFEGPVSALEPSIRSIVLKLLDSPDRKD